MSTERLSPTSGNHAIDEGRPPDSVRPPVVLSYFATDLNCPSCFNDLLQALSSTVGVEEVVSHSSTGSISVEHRVEESSLQTVITTVGRTIEVAYNGEQVMGEAHPSTRPICGCARSVPPLGDAVEV